MEKIRQRIYAILEKDPKKGDWVTCVVNIFLFCLIWINIAAAICGLIEEINVKYHNILFYIELISVAIFSVEYLLRLWVSPYKPPSLSSKNPLLSKMPPYLRYIFSPMGLIDLLAILPFYLPFITNIDLRLLRVLRMFRLLRVLKLSRYDKTTKMLAKVLDNVLQGLANVIEYRDKESGEHVKRTQLYVSALIDNLIDSESVYAEELRRLQPDVIIKAMALHDVGKIAIPDRVLQKPAKLDDDEYEIMKTHTTRGRQIIGELGDVSSSLYLKHCEDICYSHHERWDGKGYPQNLKEKEIPLTARLAAVADVYDALVCVRVYKPAMPYEKAVSIITEGSGSQFDPVIAGAFTNIKDQFINISEKYK